jgi:hypothetical protein
MTFKSLLLAATMVGGIALGASAANAQISLYSVTGGDNSIDGSFYFTGSASSFETPPSFELFNTFGGTGAYAGISQVGLASLAIIGQPNDALQFDSNGVNYTISDAVPNATSTGYIGDVVGTTATYSVSAAPEPGVWALMIAGVAMIGSALRFSRKQGALAVA